MNLFARAHAGLNLTPGERAFLKLVQGFLGAGFLSLLTAVPTVLAYNSGNQAITVAGIGIMIGAFVRGFTAAWEKYVSAQGDAPLASIIAAGAQVVESYLPLHQQAAPVAPVAPAAPAAVADASAPAASAPSAI